jgi:hypothetical protein
MTSGDEQSDAARTNAEEFNSARPNGGQSSAPQPSSAKQFASQPDDSKPWLSRRRFWTVLVGGGLTLLLVLAAAVYITYVSDVPLVISRETTYLTEPLTADGTRVDYFTAAEQLAYPPEMATAENGFRMLVEGLGTSSANSPDVRRQIYQKLGLDPSVAPTLTYAAPYDFLLTYTQEEIWAGNLDIETNRFEYALELEKDLHEPWTIEEFPMMQKWLDENGLALDLVAEAVQKPVFCLPWARSDESVNLYGATIDESQRMRSYARGFDARARYRMATGDVDGVIDDILACARLGRHLEHGGFLVENLVGIACQAMAYSWGAGSSLEHQPTEEQWQRLLDELNQLPAHTPVRESLKVERLAFLEFLQSVAHGDAAALSNSQDFEHLQNRSFGLDWNIVMRRANENYEWMLSGGEMPTADPASWGSIMSRASRSRSLADMFCGLVAEADLAEEAHRRTACKENLLRIAVAMLIYEKQHGTLPPTYTVDADGNPLHSWRVLLLPYLGYDDLYSAIRLDEPWNSRHNSQFHTADALIFQCPTGVHAAGQTIYTVVEGETCAFNGGVGKRLDAFGPRSAHLILVAERLDPVCWMDPTQEVSFATACLGINRSGATDGLGSEHAGGVHIGQRSGAVQFLSENIEPLRIPKLLEGTIEEDY